jgi:hypothetical protein
MDVGWYAVFAFLFVVLVLIVAANGEPQMLSELKVRYWTLMEAMRTSDNPLWKPVCHPSDSHWDD